MDVTEKVDLDETHAMYGLAVGEGGATDGRCRLINDTTGERSARSITSARDPDPYGGIRFSRCLASNLTRCMRMKRYSS
jgi:hypothetical protein